MNLEGKLLGNRYEIIEKIGNGGMATVYKATDKVLKRYVAVKILRDEFTTDEEFIKRFEVEAQSAARLTNANIVSIYDVGVDGNLYYIVMELIQGKTLKEIIIKERGPLPWKWSVNVAIQIASALDMAHRNNIIHRDIKPHNIIITEDGVAKVTDFGIAKAVSNSTITAFGTTIGSVHYFSPEHARGGYTDAKSDLYSLGVVMYEMVTGKVPFDADTPVSVALKHMQEDPEEPISVNPHVPLAVNKIIMRALQKDTNLRYQSAAEMLIDLKKSLRDPDGDFVDDSEYDPTAKTQVIGGEEYEREMKSAKKNKDNNGKNENKFVAFVKNHKVLTSIISLILVFCITFGIVLGISRASNPAEVSMPNIVGMSKEDAKKAVEEAKLVFEIDKEEYDKEVPEGFIISQDPSYMEEYNKVKEGSVVKVIISKGQEKTTVPDVTKKDRDEAISILEEAKLKVEVIEETHKEIEEGKVIKQDTKAGEEVFAGETVKIHVSTGTGIKQVEMVNLQNKTLEEAKKILTDLGLKFNIIEAHNDNESNDVIVKQSIEPGKKIDEGTMVYITVNKKDELKDGLVKINLKSLLNYVPEKDEEGKVIKETALVEVFVNGDKIKTLEKADKSSTNITVDFRSKGNTNVKVKVDGDLYGPQEFNMNEKTTIEFK